MTSKIDPRDIISDHISTLVDAGTENLSLSDISVFFVVPVLFGSAFTILSGVGFSDNGVGIWIGAFSILAGLLINVLVLLYTVKEVGPTQSESCAQRKLIQEVNANLLYAILVATTTIVALCILPALNGWGERIVSGSVIALAVNFALTLLMTLKRLKILVGMRFKSGAKE